MIKRLEKKELRQRILVVILVAGVITFLMGMSRINLMTRLEALGIYDFDQKDYFVRVISLFIVSLIFISANIFFNRLQFGPIRINLLKISGIIIFNILLFIPIQAIYALITIQQIEALPIRQLPAGNTGGVALWAIMTNLALMLVSVLIGAVYRFMKENYIIKIRNEMLLKETAEARFTNLKDQLNPHFLFNAFSTLNGLIDESTSKAKDFLINMSDLYRYVLNIEDKNLVALKDELDFTRLYIHLMKGRFGEALIVSEKVDIKFLALKVVPISIQLLIENAIKHNSFDRRKPLIISIINGVDYLEVKNNLIPRNVTNSNSIGLHNLNQRYQFLSNKEIIIKKTADCFSVQIPILK